jgi:hypothetical protein
MVDKVTIEKLKSEFELYRANKPRRNQPIPDEIWDNVRLAAETIPISVLRQELNLDLATLRKRLGQKHQTHSPASSLPLSVVKVCAEVPAVRKETKFTLSCPKGWSLTLEGAGTHEAIRMFHELRHGGE